MASELHQLEIGALRGEINSIIDRMNTNENFCAGAVSAVFAFALSSSSDFVSVTFAFIAVAVSFLGLWRNKEYQIQIVSLDDYIETAEKGISPYGGWVSHYRKSRKHSGRDGFSKTRRVFWRALCTLSIFGTAYVARDLIFLAYDKF